MSLPCVNAWALMLLLSDSAAEPVWMRTLLKSAPKREFMVSIVDEGNALPFPLLEDSADSKLDVVAGGPRLVICIPGLRHNGMILGKTIPSLCPELIASPESITLSSSALR